MSKPMIKARSLRLLLVMLASLSLYQNSFAVSLQVPLCKLIGSETSGLEKKQDVSRRSFKEHEGVEINMIDMRTHNAKSPDVQIEHQTVRQSIIYSYRNNKLLSKKVLDSFQEGYDKYGLDPVSYFYLTHSDPLSITGRTVLGTIKLLHFKSNDPIVEWIQASKKEDVFLKEWPLLEVEKKSGILVVEHQTKEFTEFREILQKGFDEFHKTEDPNEKDRILTKIALAKASLPESTFRVAEITGVTSVGKSKAGFDVFRTLENEV